MMQMAINTEGVKFIDVQVEGHNPFELLPLGAVPYAMHRKSPMRLHQFDLRYYDAVRGSPLGLSLRLRPRLWAEKALTVADDAIESRHIKNGTIKAEDIDPLAFSDIQGTLGDGQLPTSAATVAQLNNHLNSATAHNASAIVVSGPFITMVAGNAQEGFRKLDGKLADEIWNRQNMNINNLQGILGESKIDGAIARDSEVASAIASHNHDGTYVRITGDTMTGVLNFDGGSGETVRIEHDTGNISTPGTITANGGTMTGSLNMGGNDITNVGAGSGIGFTVADHEGRIDALEGAPTPKTCSISVYSSVIGGSNCDCRLYGLAVDFGATGTALSGLASITNIQDDGIFEKSDQSNVIAVKDDESNKVLFLLTHACDSNPAFGGLAIGTVPAAESCPSSEMGVVGATSLRNNGNLGKGNCTVSADDITFARGSL